MPTSAKWSGWSAGTAPAGTDKFVGLQGGVNVTYAFSQLLANPSGTIGTTATNGTAVTAMRSDATPALASTISAAGPIGSATVVPVITFNAAGQLTAVTTATITQPTAANPTASVGLASVNGSASTFLRSDGAPALDVTIAPTWSGLHTFSKNLTLSSGAGLVSSGNVSAAAWTVNGLRTQHAAASYTDTSSSGTVASAYTDLFGASTVLASSATTYTQYYGAYFMAPVASTNVTMTNKSALGADTVSVGGANQSTFALAVNGTGNFTSALSGTTWVGSGNATVGANSAFVVSGRGIITSPAAGSNQLGNSDVDTNASMVAITLRSQGALAGGTSDQAGKNWTFIASPGKGTGAGGSLIFQTSPAGTTGTSVNAPVTALTIDSTGLATFAASVVGTSFVPTSSITPTNGMYLSSSNQITFATNSGGKWTISSVGSLFNQAQTSGAQLTSVAATATAPTLIPNRADTTTGIGAQASGNISLTVGAAEQVRVISTGLTIISGKDLVLGNAAVTGLTAGVLSATTNATIVIKDSSGQAYRVPCII